MALRAPQPREAYIFAPETVPNGAETEPRVCQGLGGGAWGGCKGKRKNHQIGHIRKPRLWQLIR